nr:topoisomerase DNA-binding C4 zinc finger domain-containing protein [Avibacterium endocarditidis]
MSKSLFQATKHEEHCPQCGALLQIKKGKKGLFLGCSAYPQCDFIKPLQPAHESKILKDLDQHCPKCGHFSIKTRAIWYVHRVQRLSAL